MCRAGFKVIPDHREQMKIKESQFPFAQFPRMAYSLVLQSVFIDDFANPFI